MPRRQSETEKQLRLKLEELSPAGIDARVGLDEDIIALCHVIDDRFNTLLSALKALQREQLRDDGLAYREQMQ